MLKRAEIKSESTWDIIEIYKNKEEIDKVRCQISEKTDKLCKFKGQITSDIDVFVSFLELDAEISKKLATLYVYHSMLLDQDHNNDEAQGELLLIQNFHVTIMTSLSFVIPEILNEEQDKLTSLINNEKTKPFKKQLMELLDQKKYLLSEKEERIMALSSAVTSSAYDIYSTLTNTEINFETIIDSNSKEFELSEGKWGSLSQSYDRVLRKNAFYSLLNGYKNYEKTITSIYIANLKASNFNVEARGYKSSRHMALTNNLVEEQIYDNLIKAVRNKLSYNHDYISYRKDQLELSDLSIYDVYVPIVPNVEQKFPFDEAKDLVIDSLAPLGLDYVNNITTAFNERYIDIYENKGKRNGAYSSGSYETKPYILLNYTNTLNDVFTLTHELGHSMQTKYTNENQTFQDSHYKIFVAEIASTVNELFLFEHMINKDIDVKMKKYLLNYNLDQFRSTVYRQTMFSEFEYQSHLLLEKKQEINSNVLSKLYYDLNVDYFGDDIEVDDLIKYEWLRIPHFYYDYYVYQYATCFCIATKVVKEILSGNTQMKTNYLEFLKLGDSVTPIELVASLGIDIRDSKQFEEALDIYSDNLEKLKKL